MLRNFIIIIIIIIIIFPLCVNARILNVPEDFRTIQAAVDATQQNDTVLVMPGIYVENIIINRPGFTLASLFLTTGNVEFIDSTIIDGNRQGSVAAVFAAPNSPCRFIGLTLQNGRYDFGGGIRVYRRNDMVFSNLIIQNCVASATGGAIYLEQCNRVELNGLKVINNTAFDGGGIGFMGCANALFTDLEVRNNTAAYRGGGIYAFADRDLRILNSIVSNNRSENISGGLHFEYATILQNVLISGNSARIRGGAFTAQADMLTLINCTVYGNNAPTGSTIGVNAAFRLYLSNTIIREIGQAPLESPLRSVNVDYSDIENIQELLRVINEQNLNLGEGNIDADPLFLDPDNGDYRLTSDSPCIDAGDPESPPDPDGTRADMGAFYFHQRDIEVEPRELHFAPLADGGLDSQVVNIRNTGGTDLQISSLLFADDFHFFSRQDIPFTIAPDSTVTFWIYCSHGAVSLHSSATLFSDDPDEPQVVIELFADALGMNRTALSAPKEFSLISLYPNPFNASLGFSVDLPASGHLRVEAMDIAGRTIGWIANSNYIAGVYRLNWNASNNPAGVYFIRGHFTGQTLTNKVLLIK